MTGSPMIYVLAFVAVVVVVQALAGLVFSARDRTQRVNRRLAMMDSGMSREEIFSALVRRPPGVRASGRLDAFYERLELYMRQAGLLMSPARLGAITAGVAGALWLVGLSVATSGKGPGVLASGAISLIGACVLALVGVGLWLRHQRNTRIRKIEEQLPLALDVVNRAVRAGHPVISAVQLAADEMGDPVGSEFGLIVDETTYGVEFKEALANFARRTGSADGHFFAVAVSIQSETGGNLAEILEGLASVMRGRHSLGKRVKSLASEGRASAVLLSVLPVLLICGQLVFRPTVYSEKFSDPIFWPVVFLTALIYLGGWLMVHRIINFKY
ncbi:type II secretion system F family protein [Phenylobacterium sp.]|uniref:type II secretion system F family protein n=1 Tax=Phenylobacterium sp. TaxID=1871053 RepID=UPI0028977BBD|nr:type II secretion system F family protein [Phenylobacterium sp.]